MADHEIRASEIQADATAADAAAGGTTGRDRTLRLVLYDGLASEAMGTLTTGVFLAGLAVEIGASNAAIGLLAAVPFAVQLLQLPAVVLVERLRARRAICTWSAGIGRCFLLGAAVTPLLGAAGGMAALIALLALHQALAAIGGCAWNSWMRDLVSAAEHGRFFGQRTAATTALAIALAFLGSFVIDTWKGALPDHPALGYSVLFVLSALIGLFGVYLLSITPDQPMVPVDKRLHPFEMLSAPFRDQNFRRLIIFLSSWNFAANLAAPFFSVYMLKSLGYGMTTVMTLTIVSQLSNLAALGLWGALIDRFSNKALLRVCAPLFLACTLAWSLTGLPWLQPLTIYLLLAIHVLMGIATAGMALASNNIAMKLSPTGQATAYLAANSVTTASFAAVAPVIGGLCADFFAAHELTLAFTWKGADAALTVQVLNFHAWTFFFGLACVAGLYSLHRLTFVQETAGSTDPLVLRHLLLEARRSMHSLSSAAGLLRIVRGPLSLLRPANRNAG
ncbi:MFS transporter [Vineibacter terrae]|uniref:MFS transporter n=1 Tax=Vineibacter terrae TaxID=2586908 RepID=UPI0015B45733|nr:MFS transporter [Vineibacter terrae]